MDQSDLPANPAQQFEQFVVFSLDNEEYAVPVLSVAEVVATLEITPFPNAPNYIIGLANLRGKILPVLDLEKKFHLNSAKDGVRGHIMVAESVQKVQFGILVDKVKEIVKIPRDAIQPPPVMLKAKIGNDYLPGVIVLENASGAEKSRILLILDMPKILSDKTIEQLRTTLAEAGTNQKPSATALINKETS